MNEQLKFLILLFYYERPEIVKGAIESINMQHYKNFEVAYIDDSARPNTGLAEDIQNPCWYKWTEDSLEQKNARGGSMFGEFANQAMLASDADVVIPLCDDDRLTPWYLGQLNKFYTQPENLEIMSSYCDVIIHDPSIEDWKDVLSRSNPEHFLNINHSPHPGGNSKDSSQMSFRMKCVKEGGVRWPAPRTAALDYFVWTQLNNVYGVAYFNGIVGQVKSYWAKQLGGRGNTYGDTE